MGGASMCKSPISASSALPWRSWKKPGHCRCRRSAQRPGAEKVKLERKVGPDHESPRGSVMDFDFGNSLKSLSRRRYDHICMLKRSI